MGTTQNTTKISHVMLGVESTARALEFYRDKLGLSVQSEHPGFAFLDAGGFTLALSEGLARASETRVGATELVFGVEDVTAAYESLKSKGVVFTHEPRAVAGPMFAANFTDPDGHRLSIFGPERKA
ncbi:MAG TPA: VOC family protein [Candidatus Acidoferrales bacterium]|jgi:catechol 2,3-dioxygenase-like lactoylglutathione lyase family enzyme|nr:VOC family protein [Candidatus Acidoferrales bacterium]